MSTSTHRGRKGGKGLSRDRIIAAATRIARRRGASGLSMRALANDLGVAAPSLYWHFRTREDLLAAIVRGLLEGVEVTDPGGQWTERVRAQAHAIRNGVFARPELLDLLRDSRLATATLAPLGIRLLLLLEGAGFEGASCVRGARLLNWQIWSFIMHEIRLGWPVSDAGESAHVYEFPLTSISAGDLAQAPVHLMPHLARLDANELFDGALDAVITQLASELRSARATEDPS